VTVSRRRRQELERHLPTAQHLGTLPEGTCLHGILAVTEGQSGDDVARTFRVPPTTVQQGLRRLLVEGRHGYQRKKSPGRPPQPTKAQKHALAKLRDAGPVQAGSTSACWRSPMIQQLIDEGVGVFDNVFSIAHLRQHLGVSSQKAAFVSAHCNEEKRHAWCTTTWPQLLQVATAQAALLLCGDESSVPQGGTLSYPWARRGHQPMGRRQANAQATQSAV
jgi:transposase